MFSSYRLGFGFVAVSAAGAAVAEVPAEATAVLTTAAADAGAILTAGWAVLAVVVGGLIVMGLVKRVVGKAAGR